MMEQLETGNIGIGNTSTLATLNSDRFIIVDQKEIFGTGASLKDLGRKSFHLCREATVDGAHSRNWTYAKTTISRNLCSLRVRG